LPPLIDRKHRATRAALGIGTGLARQWIDTVPIVRFHESDALG
jgi:hypothetical protein